MPPIAELVGGPFPDPVPTLEERYTEVIRKYPDHVAIVCTQQPAELYGIRNIPLDDKVYRRQPYLRWSFRDLDRSIRTFANALADQGLSKGAPLFTFLPNTVEYVIATWAAYFLDCIHVPINPRNLANVAEVTHMMETVVESCGAQSVAVLASNAEISQQIDKLVLKLSGTNRRDGDGDGTGVHWVRIVRDGPVAGWVSFESLMINKIYEQRTMMMTSPGDRTVFFTSGSTSLPKGCLTRCSTFVTSQSFGRGLGAITPGDGMAVVLPNNHLFGYIMMMLALVNAATVVFPGSSFSPQHVVDGIRRERCTHTALVSTMLHAISYLGPQKAPIFDSLRHVILSGASITPEALRCCTDRLGASGVENIYGMTEGVILSTRHVRNLGDIISQNQDRVSIGTPALGSKMRLCHPGEKVPLPWGVAGEIHFSGPALINGYMGKQSDRFYEGEDGRTWFSSGDQGIIDHDGRLYVVGRYNDLIIRGGENIAPDAVESVLSQVPALQALNPQIVGSPDHISGEVPIAVINQQVTDHVTQLMQETIRIKLGAMYVAAEVVPLQALGIDDYPRTMGGKIHKAKLRELVKTFRQNRASMPASRDFNRHMVAAKLRQHWARMLGIDASSVDPIDSLTGSADRASLLLMREAVWTEVVRELPLSDWLAADSIDDQVQLLTTSKHGYLANPQGKESTAENTPTIHGYDGNRVVDSLISSIAAEKGIEVGPDTRLADIGIDSITALAILDRVNKETGLSIPSSLFFQNTLVGDLRESLRDDGDLPNNRISVRLLHGQIRPGVPCLFLFPGASGYLFSYSELPTFPNGVAVYALGSLGLPRNSAETWTMQKFVTAYLDVIRGIQPQGPYLFGGWSFGGNLCYEVAYQLREQGEVIKGLIMFDTACVKAVPNAPDPTIKLLEVASVFQTIPRPGQPDLELPLHRKQQMVYSYQALQHYIPRPVPPGATPLRIFMIWSREQNLEQTPHKLVEAAALIEQYGQETDKKLNNDWQSEPRRSFGPSGWETLVGEENIECHSVDGHHENMLLVPHAKDTARLINMAVEKFLSL